MSIAAALPRVDGRHRNKALAAARRARAVELVTQGLTYQQVADELGYANRGTVYRLVHQALARETAEAVATLKDLEVERLDALQVALWDAAMQGDVAAASEIVRIVAARCRLLGLYGQAPTGRFVPRTVVLTAEVLMSIAAALPRVDGRHRNKALAAARRARAVELVTQGLTYQQVADELGYANRGTVYRLVHQALARETAEAVATLKDLEVERLDALQVALWDAAMQGDVAVAARETSLLEVPVPNG